MKKRLWLKIILITVLAIVLAFAAFIAYLSATEYRPKERQAAEHINNGDGAALSADNPITVFSWNIGYAGLDASADFFMDGGSEVNPDKADVERNLTEIKNFVKSQSADAWMLQEVDVNSARTGNINELKTLSDAFVGSYALAYNYKCRFVPIPFPPIGRIESGIATFTASPFKDTAERISLPCPFSWPVSLANLKRCLLVTRLAVDGSDREVVLVNLHLEAYDDGEGKAAQTKQLMSLLQREYEKGNYVIAGGDFNQIFPNTADAYPITDSSWTPGVLSEDDLPDGFAYAYDESNATCRLLNKPLNADSQLYVIDGFIVSPNIQVDCVETVNLGFENSDHNPVKLQISLLS